MKEHHIIYVPGLKDHTFIKKALLRLLPLFFRPQDFTIHIIAPNWENGEKFAPKLKLITDEIDQLVKQGHMVSLIGQSAGGSAVLNAFCLRRKVITGVINNTGRLKTGVKVKPSLKWAARNSVAFKESVLLFEKNESSLTKLDRKKILTLKPIWDEIVPKPTVSLIGATNLTLPVFEHGLGGVLIETLFSPLIVKFLRSLEKRR